MRLPAICGCALATTGPPGYDGPPMRGPACMRNADSAVHAFGPHLLGQILDTRHTAGAVNFTVAHDCDATAVVATVLKAL